MLDDLTDSIKRKLNIPVTKEAKDLYYIIDKNTNKRMYDSAGNLFIITKNETKKLKDKYTTISVADVMTENYNKKLEFQRKLMKRQSMSDAEKREELTKELDETNKNEERAK